MRCRLHTDRFEDLGIFFVHTYVSTGNSSSVTLVLEDEYGNMYTRVVANHQIEWIPYES